MRCNKQSGFTLIEFAIVIAIISLMITLTAKGNELLVNSTVKILSFDFNNIQLAINGYRDKFRALPGDDRKATAHLPVTGVAVNNGNGNSVINASWNAVSGESYFLWQHIRLAGLMQGTTDTNANDYIPRNTTGGALGVSGAAFSPIPGLKGEYIICSDHIAGRLVKQLDLSMDDGNTASGMMMVSNPTYGGAAINTADINEGARYLVCMGV
jgi:prepilin-type N-terminal cleavage/methylation domain-containing protein